MKREALAVISLDRRKLHGDDDEQWRHDGVRVVRDLAPEYDLSSSELEYLIEDVPTPPGSRFVLWARWAPWRDYETGIIYGDFDDVELVPLTATAKVEGDL